MDFSGPLGLPRVTSLGPLVSRDISVSAVLSKEAADEMVRQIADDNDIPRNDFSEGDLDLMIEEVASTIYPRNNPVLEAKNSRFKSCMTGKWANAWADGLEANTDNINFTDDLDRVRLMAQGCAGVTEANTAGNEIIIPERFKR